MNIYLVAAIWMTLAFVAAVISIKTGISVALVEILVGALAGNIWFLSHHIEQTSFTTFLASVGSLMLTFLAGAEIDPVSLKRHWKASVTIGIVSFLLPFLGAVLFTYFVLGWNLQAAEIAGVALSTTSVAVVYAVMVETGLNKEELGKLILAACFVTDLGTVLALGGIFASFQALLVAFVVVTAVVLVVLPATTRRIIRSTRHRVSEPEIKFLLAVLLWLGALAVSAGSEAVLPAYLVGLVIAGVFMNDRVLIDRMRSIAFALFTPFFFLRAGLLIQAPAVVSGAGVIAVLLAVKLTMKGIGVWPTAGAFKIPARERAYLTLLMATGLTFGSIAALFGLTNGFIDQDQYSQLVTVVILSAFVPTIIAQQLFQPTRVDVEEEEALGAEDVSPVRRHLSPSSEPPLSEPDLGRGADSHPARRTEER